MLTAIIAGLALGLITGLLPGISVTTLLLSSYFVLTQFSILELFIFYAVLMTSLQYYGNVSSILYGVYGEITSGPAVKHGHALFQKNTQLGIDALIYSATGSFFASCIALALIAVSFQYADLLAKAFGNTVKVAVITTAMISLIAVTRSKLAGIAAAVAGVVLGKVGYDILFDTRFLAGSESNMLDGGIPAASVFVGLIALPQLWKLYRSKENINITNWQNVRFGHRLRVLFTMPYKMAALRGSVIGLVTGLVPGISYAISSAAANSIEERLCKKQSVNEVDTQFRCVVSAESANNAGSMIVLIPLLVLAIPVIPSETIIFSIAEKSGFGFATSYTFLLKYGELFVLTLLAVNVINWVLAGIFYNAVARVFTVLKTYIYQIMIVFLIVIVAVSASHDNQILLTLTCLFLFTVVGLISNDDHVKTTFLFAFFLADPIVNEYYRFALLNF